jgi:hypothetical protein
MMSVSSVLWAIPQGSCPRALREKAEQNDDACQSGEPTDLEAYPPRCNVKGRLVFRIGVKDAFDCGFRDSTGQGRNERMRRLKLEMQVSIDGMVGTRTQRDRGHFNWDDEVRQYSIANAANVDCILLGRKTADGFIPHWKSAAANPKDPIVRMVSLGQFHNLRPTPR